MNYKLSTFLVGALAGTAAAQPAPPAPTPAPAPTPTPAPADQAPAPAPAPAPGEPVAGEPAVPVTPPEPPKDDKDKKTGTTGYDKGFFIKNADGNYSLKINARVQPFYTLKLGRDPVDFQQAFEIRRARLTLEGNIHTKRLGYKFQTDFGKGFVSLKDYYIDAEPTKNVWVRAGQWKRPFSRQQITSSGKLEITDRSITDKAFLGSRDIGLAVHNNYEKSPDFEWIVGVFNGTGDTAKLGVTVDPVTGAISGGFSNIPAKFKPVWVARAGINRNGIKGYTEADLEGGPLRFGVAANIAVEGDNDDDDKSQQRAGVDYVVKSEGFSTTGGFYLLSDQDEVDKITAQKLSFIGFHVQAGYMVTPHIQGVARYAFVDERLDDMKNGDLHEISIGGNYYLFGHDAKLAGAVRLNKVGDAKFGDGILVEIGANVGF